MNNATITNDDAIFFLDMMNHRASPNHVQQMHHSRPFYKILNDRNSDEFKRFINIYIASKHLLNEREQKILDDVYGITERGLTLKEASIPHNITLERVRQIRVRAERRITSALLWNMDKL